MSIRSHSIVVRVNTRRVFQGTLKRQLKNDGFMFHVLHGTASEFYIVIVKIDFEGPYHLRGGDLCCWISLLAN